MATYEARLASFASKKWPYLKDDLYPSIEKFALAGFSYSGENDTVICFQCGKHLDGWEPSDMPYEAHTSHGYNSKRQLCPLLRLDELNARLETFGGKWRQMPGGRLEQVVCKNLALVCESRILQLSYERIVGYD